MDYNSNRNKLVLKEYGRHVQKIVEACVEIKDRERRNIFAKELIELMGQLNPHLRNVEDFRHKLWDHLYQMTDFNLDVDSPYPCPTPEMIFKKPEVLPYPQEQIQHRHLGKNIQALLDKALAETDEEKRHGLTQAIGYYMKLAYANWHKEPVHDDMIKSELKEITGGQLRFESGGARVHFDNNRNNNFKQRNNNNNRNFKGNQGGQGGGQRNNNFRDRDNNGGGGYGNNNYNKNRKFKKK